MKTIELPVNKIKITVSDNGSGSITSELHEYDCPYCGQDCDETDHCDGYSGDIDGLVAEQNEYNERVHGVESLILAMACEGIFLESPAMLCAIETALNSCANN